MDALAKIFSSNKTKTNVSPDGGAPDTVGTTVAHTPVGNAQTPASEVPESTALDSGKHRDSAVHEMKSGVGAPPPESADANPPDEGRTLEGAGRSVYSADNDEAHGPPLQTASLSGKAVQSVNVGSTPEQELSSDKKSVNVAPGLNTYDSAGYAGSNSYREPSIGAAKGEAEQPIGKVMRELETAVKTLHAGQLTVQKMLEHSGDVMQHFADRLDVLESRTPSSAPKAGLLARLNAAAVYDGPDAAGKCSEKPMTDRYEAPKATAKPLPPIVDGPSELKLRVDEARPVSQERRMKLITAFQLSYPWARDEFSSTLNKMISMPINVRHVNGLIPLEFGKEDRKKFAAIFNSARIFSDLFAASDNGVESYARARVNAIELLIALCVEPAIRNPGEEATENAANFELTAAFSASATAYSKQIERLRRRVVEMTDKEGKSYVNAVIEGLDQICASRSPVVITKQLKETRDATSVLKGHLPSRVLESTHQSYVNHGHSNEKATIDAVADLTSQVESLRETHQNMDMILAKLLDFTGYNSDLRELVEHLERIEQTVGPALFAKRATAPSAPPTRLRVAAFEARNSKFDDGWTKANGVPNHPIDKDRPHIHVGNVCRKIGLPIPPELTSAKAGELGGFHCPCNHFRKVAADKWVMFGEHKAAPDLQLKHAYSKCRHIYAELHKHVKAHPEDAHLFDEIASGSECIAA